MNRVPASVTMPLLSAAVTVASAAGVLVGPPLTAIAGGILLGFVLPGLALTEILFRRRTLSPVERIVLAPGLSLATLISSGLLLYAGGIHLDRTSWTLAAAGVTLVVLALTAVPQRVWHGADEPTGGAEPAEDRELVSAESVRIRPPGEDRGPAGADTAQIRPPGTEPAKDRGPASAKTAQIRPPGTEPANDHEPAGADTAQIRPPGTEPAENRELVDAETTRIQPTGTEPANDREPAGAKTAQIRPPGTEPANDHEPAGAETARIQPTDADEVATEFIPVIRDGNAPPPGTPRALPGPFSPWSAEHKVQVRRLIRQLLPMIMVVAVLAGAGYLSFVSSRASYDVAVTRLSAAPPGPVNAAGNRVVEVTASGLTADSGPYDLLVTDEAGIKVLEQVIAVDADGTWSAALTLPSAGRLTVGLLRATDTTPYRTLLIAAAP